MFITYFYPIEKPPNSQTPNLHSADRREKKRKTIENDFNDGDRWCDTRSLPARRFSCHTAQGGLFRGSFQRAFVCPASLGRRAHS